MRPEPDMKGRIGPRLAGLPRRLLERVRGANVSGALPSVPKQAGFSINDAHVSAAPCHQHAIDLVESWTCLLPPHLGVAGSLPLCTDELVTWAIQVLGGVVDKRVLELGPLEGSHTFMLEQAGANSILGIEANKQNFLKCLIAKEIFDLKRSRFLLGDFMKYLSSTQEIYDIAWVAGVLYHMEDPIELIRLVSEHAEKLYMYTHYIDEATLSKNWTNKIMECRKVVRGAREYDYYYRSYCGAEMSLDFTGGVYSGSVWLRKQDIMDALCTYGFTNIVVRIDYPDHPNGPAIVLAAMKE